LFEIKTIRFIHRIDELSVINRVAKTEGLMTKQCAVTLNWIEKAPVLLAPLPSIHCSFLSLSLAS